MMPLYGGAGGTAPGEGQENGGEPTDQRTEGEDESIDKDDDDRDESVEQGGNIEGENAESTGGTDSTDPEPDDGAVIDGRNPMPMPQPNNPGSVSINGTATEDETLTANTGTLDDADGLGALSYQWQHNTESSFENIENATGETYTLGDEDVGREVQVMVSYTDDGGMDESLTSDATAAVGNVNDLPTGDVTIDGTVRGDETLTANTGALADEDGLPDDAAGYNYQWQRSTDSGGFEDIEDATGQNYTLGDEDIGREVRVQISYTDGNSTAGRLWPAG